MPTRNELVLEFLKALAGGGVIEFNTPSVDRAYALAEALADKYLANQ
jgi:hypothetical protein